jgi:chromosome segregation protein
MEDVIFAGTSGRAPLGRAEVAVTIDNTDGALPIDFTEVTISRILFRNGQSDYQINGENCRLLDIQELLSDSGIGREMHVIVGQGQLDAILMANPEERRGFIEEAAGILKHRKRKEKALRKLESMQQNMSRVQDLTNELKRQLRPLGKQAEVAKKAAVIQAEVRDARLRILADDVASFRTTLNSEVADESALRARRIEVEQDLDRLRNREVELDRVASVEGPLLSARSYAALRIWLRSALDF